MTDNNLDVSALLQGLQNIDPRLYEILLLLTADLNEIRTVVIPTTVQHAIDVLNAPAPLVHAVDSLIYTILSTSVRFNWTETDPNVKQYELRKGSVWATANFQTRTIANQVDINPLPEGTTRFILRTINADGVVSLEDKIIDVVVNDTPAPVIRPQVIDNNVLLIWDPPVSAFSIDHYNVYKDGNLIGQQAGTFFSTFEVFSGTFTYSVEAVDIVGNVGSRGNVTIAVSEPPDFVLQDSRVSNLSGTKVNVILESGPKLLCCVNTTETWHNHFLSRGWGSIAAQVAAGYNRYGEPYALTGSYQEVIDYGAVFTSLVVNMDWSVNVIVGNVAINATIEASTDGTTWSVPSIGKSAFFTELRYARITLTFTPTDDKSSIEFFNFRIFLNTKLVLTSGSISAKLLDNASATPSTHLGGTYVAFVKPYKSVNSITLTTNSQQPITAIYDLIGVANPDGFKIFVFDSAGIRIDQQVSWKVRGTI